MTYYRVIPRDLFNEANLLKCLGRLALLVHDGQIPGLIVEHEGESFEIRQDDGDGSIYCENLEFYWDDPEGPLPFNVHRNLNSLRPWPLFEATTGQPVFDDEGNFIFVRQE